MPDTKARPAHEAFTCKGPRRKQPQDRYADMAEVMLPKGTIFTDVAHSYGEFGGVDEAPAPIDRDDPLDLLPGFIGTRKAAAISRTYLSRR